MKNLDYLNTKDNIITEYFLIFRKLNWNKINSLHSETLLQYEKEQLLDLYLDAQPIFLAIEIANKKENILDEYTEEEIIQIANDNIFSDKYIEFLKKLK